MLTKTKAIVLSAIRYQEKSLIVKCFTQSQGVVSYFVPSAFSNKKNSQRIAYFQPLTILEIEVNHKGKGGLKYFKEVKTAVPYHSIPFDVVKSTITLFLSEILHYVIKEEEKNEPLYLFLETAMTWLDTHDYAVNFHINFLIELTKFLGFYPDLINEDFPFFDLNEGCFVLEATSSVIDEETSHILKLFMSSNFDDITNFKLDYLKRQRLLEVLLDFYALHIENFKKPYSLEVLKEFYHT
ncbi:DNA repair protein RecO [Flavobacterium davisii]|uniref:DNA repair protein RecO n=1 Tax=Flavobacterium davisii TaxID=2906077 RepID=A0A246GL93_9FLAO|nr:DNA repair protein RecO [Flavobacterium davisii]OWP84450.1 DNA repair protein RecO [Flavobacterium davisii]